ncbi:YraN family protein [Methylacidiphilum caldifontis]|uniref:YraN family protein n=1 Tax=Methylacidiphilum caldifontis TaxID=2795386 RepID=UPI001A8DD90B|nr:YraN family protein [Methylacidiphilum caldifontis]QSR88825.1 YraN family protein [Methylacidiphilum caldifontis]
MNPNLEHVLVDRQGQKLAALFLRKLGYKILLKNVRVKGYDLDLVCRDKERLVFVGVNSRSSLGYGFTQGTIDSQKRRNMVAAAYAYLDLLKKPGCVYQFDVVEVLFLKAARPKITHYPNAFGLGEMKSDCFI